MKRILVVDNHPVVRKFMSELVAKRGHNVHTAKDGLTALETLEFYTPDLVFIDLVMPNIDGNKLCQVIRSRSNLDDCFIVVLSGIAVEELEKSTPEEFSSDLILAKGPFDKLAWQVDYIINHLEAGRLHRLKGGTIGEKNLTSRQITKELLSSKRHYEMTLNNMSEGLLELTQDAKITYANPAALSIIGRSEENLLSADFVKLLKNEDQARIRQELSRVGRSWHEPILDEILRINSKLISTKILSFNGEDQQYTLVVMLMDVSLQKQTEQELVKRKEQYKQQRNFLDNIFENSPDAIAIVDEHGRITRWNNNASHLFGYNFDEMKGKKAFDLYTNRREMENMLDLLRKQGYVQNYEINFFRKDGTTVPCALSISLLYNDKKEKIGSLSIIRDLSEWKVVEERLRYLSFHDSLTGAYNRAFFEEELERLATQRHLPLGIIVCDINRLKHVNDTMGHQKGDELIQSSAGILKRSFRSSDVIARIGGDEFAILVPQGSQDVIEDCIKRIKEGIGDYNAQNQKPELSIAIGYAISSNDSVNTKVLFKKADDNMYIEKEGQS